MTFMRNTRLLTTLTMLLVLLSGPAPAQNGTTTKTLTGQAAFTDFSQEHPGVRRRITVADLPEPKPEESFDGHDKVVARPDGAWPIAPAGFKVERYAQDFEQPRLIRMAPNGSRRNRPSGWPTPKQKSSRGRRAL